MTSQTLREARKYEETVEKSIAKEERPDFHLCSRVGWMNDPNGFCYYNGMYHLFYQANMTGSYFCIWRGALAFYFFRSDSGMLRVYCKSLQI